jgi:signal transduction histidine kinase
MDSAVASHIFDPFFTTKPSGTGLGLSISHELVRAHGGDIKIESEQGRGTNVMITIPNSLA